MVCGPWGVTKRVGQDLAAKQQQGQDTMRTQRWEGPILPGGGVSRQGRCHGGGDA